MKIFKRIFFIFLFLSIQFSNAQETMLVNDDFQKENFKKYISVFSTEKDVKPNDLINNNSVKWEENKASYGFSTKLFWLKFKIKNISNSTSDLYFEVDNPHLRYIEFYEQIEGKLVLKYKCGRHMSFDSRPVDNVKFIFPIELLSSQTSEFYIKIDKRKSSVSFPTTLWNKNEFTKVSNKVNLFNGVYFGGLILAILYSLMAYFNLKRKLYLNYSLYILFLGLYMFTSAGYAFQYLAKDSILFNSYFRVITLTMMIYFHAKFLQSLFKTKKFAKKIDKSITFFANALLIITAIWFVFEQFDKSFVTLYLKTNYSLIIVLIINFLLACIYTYGKLKKIVKLYLLSFSAIIAVGIWLVVLEYGWLPSLRTNISPLYLGSLIEIIILSIVLISEMRLVLNEKEDLSIKIAEKQQEIIKAYVDGIEKEKLRISEELHDDIGSKLSNLNQFIAQENSFSNTTRKKIENIISDVRSISHKLSPNKESFFSFKEQIENVADEALLSTSIKYELHISDDYSFLKDTQKLNIYRIVQECLHNIVKHSKASFVEVQLTKIEDELMLTIEDNGIGFSTDTSKKGLGLVNIHSRVDYLKGKLEISSIPNKGTFILVLIPLV